MGESRFCHSCAAPLDVPNVEGDGGGTGTPDDPFRGLAAADAAATPGSIFTLAPGIYLLGVGIESENKSDLQLQPIGIAY